MSRWSKISGLGAVMMVARSLAAVISPARQAGLAHRQTADAADPPPVNVNDGHPSGTAQVTHARQQAANVAVGDQAAWQFVGPANIGRKTLYAVTFGRGIYQIPVP